MPRRIGRRARSAAGATHSDAGHQLTVGQLFLMLRNHFTTAARQCLSPMDVVLDEEAAVVQRTFIHFERAAIDYSRHLGAPIGGQRSLPQHRTLKLAWYRILFVSAGFVYRMNTDRLFDCERDATIVAGEATTIACCRTSPCLRTRAE